MSWVCDLVRVQKCGVCDLEGVDVGCVILECMDVRVV